jgi:hypothetical protein
MKQSTRWKTLERVAAAKLSGQRVPRWLDFGQSAPDVIAVAGPYRFVVDCKAHQRFSHHSLVENIERKYCDGDEIPLLISKAAGQHGEFATLPLDTLAALLSAVRETTQPKEKCT